VKLWDSLGPNPRVVRMFLAEKGIDIPRESVDVISGENRQAAHLARNPHGQTPALELDDGGFLCEVLPICEYLEELHPQPPLIGDTPKARAQTRMWARRVDLNICEPLTNAYRYSGGLRLFASRMVTIPGAADGLRKVGLDRLAWLDGQMDGKDFLCGQRFTLADIHLFSFLSFAVDRGLELDPAWSNVAGWLGRMGARASAKA
jgi:glutathione S-transferase